MSSKESFRQRRGKYSITPYEWREFRQNGRCGLLAANGKVRIKLG